MAPEWRHKQTWRQCCQHFFFGLTPHLPCFMYNCHHQILPTNPGVSSSREMSVGNLEIMVWAQRWWWHHHPELAVSSTSESWRDLMARIWQWQGYFFCVCVPAFQLSCLLSADTLVISPLQFLHLFFRNTRWLYQIDLDLRFRHHRTVILIHYHLLLFTLCFCSAYSWMAITYKWIIKTSPKSASNCYILTHLTF